MFGAIKQFLQLLGFGGFLFLRPKDQRLTGADDNTSTLNICVGGEVQLSSPHPLWRRLTGGKNKPEGKMLTWDVQIIEYSKNILEVVNKKSQSFNGLIWHKINKVEIVSKSNWFSIIKTQPVWFWIHWIKQTALNPVWDLSD